MNTVENAAVETVVASTSLKSKLLGLASNPIAQKTAIGAGAVVGLGLVGWGAKKLYDRHQAKKASATPAKDAVAAAVASAAPVAESA